MVDLDNAVVAKIKKGSENFEILVDCEKALEFRQGKDIPLDDILATDAIFKDSKKGLHANEHEMQKLFKTSDKREIAKIIIKEGVIQLTAEYKNKLREEKRKQIINLIHRNAVDPKTSLPHPIQRIENAFEEAKVNIDEFKKAEDQLKTIVDKIRPILPLKYEIRELSILIPAQFSGACYGPLKRFSRIIKEEWKNNGDLFVLVEIPAGLQQSMYDELNKIAHGQIEAKIVSVK